MNSRIQVNINGLVMDNLEKYIAQCEMACVALTDKKYADDLRSFVVLITVLLARTYTPYSSRTRRTHEQQETGEY